MTPEDRIALLTLERDALLAQCDKLQGQVQELLALLDQVTSLLARKKKAQGQPNPE